jgi:hypothetical protein
MNNDLEYRKGLEDLAQTMRQHIADRGNSDTVNLLWAGFLAGMQIQSCFEPDDYHDLNDILKDVGKDELGEILVGIEDENAEAVDNEQSE